MHWTKKWKFLSHAAHLYHHPLLKRKFVVIQAPSVGDAEPWKPSTVNTTLNASTLLVAACDPFWEIHRSNIPEHNTYMHLQLSSRLRSPRRWKHLGISITFSLQSSDMSKQLLKTISSKKARKQKNGAHCWRRGACFTDMVGEKKGKTHAKMSAGLKTSMSHWWYDPCQQL